jgi:hypothetical protein
VKTLPVPVLCLAGLRLREPRLNLAQVRKDGTTQEARDMERAPPREDIDEEMA